MKLFNAIAAAAVIGTSLIGSTPASASIVVDLYRGTATMINDGNPYGYTVQGTKTFKGNIVQ